MLKTIGLSLVIACVQPMPPIPPLPPLVDPPCSSSTLPPLVKSWLTRVPLTDPNDDERTLLVSWAKANCTP